jgi:hypothetical protein
MVERQVGYQVTLESKEIYIFRFNNLRMREIGVDHPND